MRYNSLLKADDTKDNPFRVIDIRRLTGNKKSPRWPSDHFGSNLFVLDVDVTWKEIHRFKFIFQHKREDSALLDWKTYNYAYHRFHTPSYNRADRTFFREELEAIYVDKMGSFIGLSASSLVVIEIQDLPLVSIGNYLLSSWWQRFYHLKNLTNEAVWRLKHRIRLPENTKDYDLNPKLLMAFQRLYSIKYDWII